METNEIIRKGTVRLVYNDEANGSFDVYLGPTHLHYIGGIVFCVSSGDYEAVVTAAECQVVSEPLPTTRAAREWMEDRLIELLGLDPVMDFRFFKGEDKKFYWRTVARNTQKDGRSGQSYARRRGAVRNARKFGWVGDEKQIVWLDETKD